MSPIGRRPFLSEAIPDGTFGRSEPKPAWTKAEQDQHYADLCDAIGAPNDRLPKRNN